MIDFIFAALVVLTPLVVLFSGMAMTPILGLLVLLLVWRVRGQFPPRALPEKWILVGMACILAWPLVTALWSITPSRSLHVACKVMGICSLGGLGLWAARRVATLPSPRMLVAYAAIIVFCGVLMLQEKAIGNGAIYHAYSALGLDYAIFMLKNINRGICALTVLVWPLMGALFLRGRTRDAWAVLAVLLLGVLAMHSLSAKIGLLAGIVGFWAIPRYPVWAPRPVNLLLPLFLLSFPLLFLAAEQTVFANETVRGVLPASSLHRVSIWHTLLTYLDGHLWQGWGMDTTRALPLSATDLATLGLTEPPLHPHSPSLQILVEQGVIGLALSVGGVFLLLRQWARMPQGMAKTSAGAMILSYFVTGVSSFGIWQTWWIAVLWTAILLWQWFVNPKAPQ